MSQDLMNYEQMTQLALRGVIRDAIRRVIREDGLPGAHHFYITFQTRYPGVEIDDTLAKKYPEEITIVLEHQFWDLSAHADEFEVTLKFGGIPKYLKVPYLAITRFHDPSVGFALQFDISRQNDENSGSTVSTITPKSAKSKKKSKDSDTKTANKDKSGDDKSGSDDNQDGDDAGNTKKVISLDSFRKK